MAPKTTAALSYDVYNAPIGKMYLVFAGKYLTAVSFSKPRGVPYRKGAASAAFKGELDSYFRGTLARFRQQVRFLDGTEFERSVWDALKGIPFGETRTYKWIAEKIGNPSAVRAVGRALSKNPVPVVIPCHRVIEADGSIGGYSSGVEIKRRLLDLEYYSGLNTR
jgi:methylated-DNA-[protein]-cysteine S-methyltransferase